MWKFILVPILLVILAIIGLSLFLAPNDMAGCGETPTTGDCASADEIVAVSGGDTNARADYAIQLYKDGWAKKLIFSGAARDKSGPSNAEVMRLRAVDAGVPETAIFIEENSNNTSENASETEAFIGSNDRVILVTSAYHQRRASLEFAKSSPKNVKIVNAPVAGDKQWSGLWWLTPVGWWLALSELAKIIVFYIGGLF